MECLKDKTEQERFSDAWGPVGDMTPRTDTQTHKHSMFLQTSKPGDPGEAKRSSFQHYVAYNCQRCLLLFHNDDQAHHCTEPYPCFFYKQSCLANDKRLFMIPLPSSYTYCLTYVVPYISLTPSWTQHIHLMQWMNGNELVSALGPLGTRLGAERTLIPIHPRQIHFLALTQSKAQRSDRFESR